MLQRVLYRLPYYPIGSEMNRVHGAEGKAPWLLTIPQSFTSFATSQYFFRSITMGSLLYICVLLFDICFVCFVFPWNRKDLTLKDLPAYKEQ